MSDALQVFTTAHVRELAEQIAEQLVSRRLAACVQVVGPVLSVYRWEGKMDSSQEWLCIIKTRQARYAEVEATIRELHPYEVPEIIATPITAGAAAYLEWLAGATN